MIQSYFINGPPSRTHTALSGWDYATRGEHASVLRMIFNPVPCLFLSPPRTLTPPQHLSAVPFASGPGKNCNCRHLCPGCPQLLAHPLTPMERERLVAPKASEQQHEKATFNYWVKRCVEILRLALCLFFAASLLLPPTPNQPPLSPVLRLIHAICFGTVRHVVEYTSPAARLPKYHCFIVLFS